MFLLGSDFSGLVKRMPTKNDFKRGLQTATSIHSGVPSPSVREAAPNASRSVEVGRANSSPLLGQLSADSMSEKQAAFFVSRFFFLGSCSKGRRQGKGWDR